MKKHKMRNFKLDKEEADLLASVERGEWKSVSNLKEEIAFAKKAAANSLRKNARINIRLSSVDLQHLKQKAVYEGIPYQTLIASILHKYAAGHSIPSAAHNE
jgi:predicted DNA binding CopG/RHH family protein